MKTKIIFFTIGVFFGILSATQLIPFYTSDSTNNPNTGAVATSSELYRMPKISLPLKYFSSDQISWGSTGGNSEEAEWEEGAVDIGARSVPTTTITLKSYLNLNEPLPPTATPAEVYGPPISAEILERACAAGLCTEPEDTPYRSLKERQLQEYGDFASRFLMEGYYITSLRKFDVTGDGIPEKIVSLCGIGGKRCPHFTYIISDDRIIFTAGGGIGRGQLIEMSTNNGFEYKWFPIDEEWRLSGACCPVGYKLVRFVYENGEFVPLYEQKVFYMEVHNSS